MYLYIIKRTLRVDSADMTHPVGQWVKKDRFFILSSNHLGKKMLKICLQFLHILHPKKCRQPEGKQYSPLSSKARKESGQR